jgi:cell division protein FtsB
MGIMSVKEEITLEENRPNTLLDAYRSLGKSGKVVVWIFIVLVMLVIIGILGGPDQSKKIAHLKAENRDLRAENKDLQAANSDLQAQTSKLQIKNADLQSQEGNAPSKEVSVNEGLSKSEEQDLQEKVAYLESENADLKAKVEDLKSENNAQAAAPGTKHVKVVVSSNIPVDVSISDDDFEWVQQGEISGNRTYEHDISEDSGLTVSASNFDQSGQVYVGVYEDGQLVAEDSDPQYARVRY